MVVSAATQPPSTYLLWKRFSFPSDRGSYDAVAVPDWVANQLNATYSTILGLMMVHFWSIVVGLIVFFFLRKHKMKPYELHPLAPTLWNKRADLIDSMIETFTFAKAQWRHFWVGVLLLLILAAWVGQTAMGILVPPLIILGSAAPVNPSSIYLPNIVGRDDFLTAATVFALEVPSALRALGSTVAANDDLTKKVRVSQPKSLGKSAGGDDMFQLDYGYTATGADFGLQHFPDLTLKVSGSCFTDYSFLTGTTNTTTDDGAGRIKIYTVDDYQFLGDQTASASLFDGRQPTAQFFTGDAGPGAVVGRPSNTTWVVVVSSVGRQSFSTSTDPWYLTEPSDPNDVAQNKVKHGRPALSCWQDDVWSYRGVNSNVIGLTSDILPGLALPENLQTIIADRLYQPMIYTVGSHLQTSSLLSATTATGEIFDAGSSTMFRDMQRLVLAAYIATTNMLTDTTLYPTDAATHVPNMQRDDSGQVLDGIGDFVVWNADVSALSVKLLIVIPSVFVGIWALAIVLLYWTPVGVVNALDSNNMHQELTNHHQDAVVRYHASKGAIDQLIAFFQTQNTRE